MIRDSIYIHVPVYASTRVAVPVYTACRRTWDEVEEDGEEAVQAILDQLDDDFWSDEETRWKVNA